MNLEDPEAAGVAEYRAALRKSDIVSAGFLKRPIDLSKRSSFWKELSAMRHVIFIAALLGIACTGAAQDKSDQAVGKKTAPQTAAIPTGKQMYGQYCASCHGPAGLGDGPVAPVLKTRPADLTTLAKRHNGVFPTQYVEEVLRFGKAPTAHGTSDMPTWGPIFRWLDGKQKSTVEQRIKNLTKYLATLQQK